MPSLTIKTGPAKGRSFKLTDGPQSIGRSADIQVVDTSASRKHAEVFKLGEMYFIRDLDSRNGTLVNDTKITKETALRIGDHIRIGAALLVFGEQPTGVHAVEFVTDAVPTSSTVEIRLGDRAEVVAGADTGKTGAMGRLLTIYEASRVLGRENTLQGVIDKMLDLAMSSAKPTYCYIFIRDEPSGSLQPKAWRDPTRNKRREISHSIVTRAMRLRRSILTADAVTDSRFNQSDSVVIGEIRSVICAPLIARDRINGVLYAGRDATTKPFTDADLELVTAIAFQTGIALENVATHSERRTELLSLVKILVGAMDLRWPELRGHGERVAAYAAAVADDLGLGKEESEDVTLAALLHDTGKMNITENARLAVSAALGQTVQEQFCHAYFGAKMLEDLPGLSNIIPGVKYHHERLDGFGGPEGLSGEAIPLIARIVAVGNRFDHLLSDPLHDGKPLPMNQALEIIEQPGEGLDDPIAHALVQAQKTGSGVQMPKFVLQEFY